VSERPVSRAADLAALGHRGTLAADDRARAEQALQEDPDPRVRAAALGALLRAGRPDRALEAWARSRHDPDPTVRRRCAELAPALPASPAVVSALVALLDDDDVTVVEAAAWALGEIRDVDERGSEHGTVAALARVVSEHPDALAREAAVAALGALGDPAALPAVLAACNDRPAVRRRAVLALAPFDGDAVDAALTRALADKDWQVRQAAEDLTR
jgi:HEAT repeat protein